MSRWEHERTIEARRSPENGELMLSASDVVAWLREHAKTITPRCYGPALDCVADSLAGLLLDATRGMLDDGSES
jgi:hypothetical protein